MNRPTPEQEKGAHGEVETMMVIFKDDKSGTARRINKSDFDPSKHDEPKPEKQEEEVKPFAKMTKAELNEFLTGKGVEVPEDATKADLVAMAEEQK